jgi:hypothetical protein
LKSDALGCLVVNHPSGGTMSDMQERPLTAEEKSEFESRGAMALKNLGVTDAQASPESLFNW